MIIVKLMTDWLDADMNEKMGIRTDRELNSFSRFSRIALSWSFQETRKAPLVTDLEATSSAD